ncbi:MAG TPA: S8 family serine peptidase [Thermomicrobiales bacterium]|jgi:hypothetical protein
MSARAKRVAGFGITILLLQLLAACAGSATPTPPPATPTARSGTPIAIGTPGRPPANATDVKIDSVLLDVAATYRREGRQAAEQQARDAGLLGNNNELRLTLILSDTNTQPIVDKVKGIGGRVGSVVDNMVDVILPLDLLASYVASNNPNNPNNSNNIIQELASFSTVREVQVTRRAQTEGLSFPPGMSLDEAQPLIAAAAAEGITLAGAESWHTAGITGKGIKIGIIDVGFKGYESLLGTALPQRVGFRSFSTGSGTEEVHGTAVAEIVHAMAPDAELILCPFDTQADYARALRYLTDEAKVQVIQMSFGWHDTRGDGNGFTQMQIDYARSKGVLPVKSAGNEGDTHYTATFAPDGNGRHQFAPGKPRLHVGGTDGEILLYLIWDAWNDQGVDYNIYLEDERGTRVAKSENVQPTKTPYERISFAGKKNTNYYAVIEANGEQRAVRLDLFGKDTPLEKVAGGSTPLTSISAPGDARGAFTVGATNVRDDKLEVYSSQGPTLDGRQKPDISGPARVTTTAYAGRPFLGTSASTPHVSGAAALVFSAQQGATADQVQAFLTKNAKDVDTPGPESKTGTGRLALGPVDAARTPLQVPDVMRGAAFTDPFTEATSGLPNSGEGAYTGGSYTLSPNAAKRATWATYGANYGDATIEATLQAQTGEGAAGLVFWQTSGDEYYLFAITTDGYYQLARYQRGGWATLIGWTKSAAIDANGPNTLRLKTSGAQITPAINGQTLLGATAPAAGIGRVGLLATTFARPGFVAQFTRYTVAVAP